MAIIAMPMSLTNADESSSITKSWFALDSAGRNRKATMLINIQICLVKLVTKIMEIDVNVISKV